MTWYEFDKQRLVDEYAAMQSCAPHYRLRRRRHTELLWEGEIRVEVAGVTPEPLIVRIVYPQSFPAWPPTVEIVSPILPPEEVGHNWHRWAAGNVCFIRPRDWDISTTAEQIANKVADWYFNYVAVKHGLVNRMP